MFFKSPNIECWRKPYLRTVFSVAGGGGDGVSRTPLADEARALGRQRAFFDVGNLCGDLEKKYPAGWRVNTANFVGVVLCRVDVRVYRRWGDAVVGWEDGLVDVDWVVRPRPAGRNERIATTMERLPECLAGVFLMAVLGGHELDPASIPEWLREPLKEAVRLEHERVDRLFRGL